MRLACCPVGSDRTQSSIVPRGHDGEERVQDSQIDAFVTQREVEVGADCIVRPVSGREHAPPTFLPQGVLVPDGDKRVRSRHLQAEGGNKRRIARRAAQPRAQVHRQSRGLAVSQAVTPSANL